MNFSEFLNNNVVYLDGGMGTLLQERGLLPGEYPERWNITHPDVIREIHKSYFDVGSNVVLTNTFGANRLKFDAEELEEIIKAAIFAARSAASESKTAGEKFVALDIGPTGKLLRPYGDLDFEDAVSIFAETVKLGVKHGADLIFIETMNDSYETKAATLAAKENSNLPIIVTNAYGKDGKLMTGASPEAMAVMLEGLGVTAIGANCSVGPRELIPVIKKLAEYSSLPLVLKPNAGLPREVMGECVFDVSAEDFADAVSEAMKFGVRAVGGCCGTTPEYIRAVVSKTFGQKAVPVAKKSITAISSYTHAVRFGDAPVLIGERINPTGKKLLRAALTNGDYDYVLSEAIKQQERGAAVLDVNAGLPDIDETAVLTRTVCEIQSVVNLPLQIDTANAKAMESALRRYNGKPLINSVSGKQESMREIFPLVKKYGGVVVALTLDEQGIPETAAGRVKIAEKILRVAAEYGIDKKDIIFDTLTMTVSTGAKAARTTLNALAEIKEKLGCHTSLGVSNVSYGLPNRDVINSTFFAMALAGGLDAAIMNPYSAEMMKTYYAYRALNGYDESCLEYIKVADTFSASVKSAVGGSGDAATDATDLQDAIIKGLGDRAAEITERMLIDVSGIEVINGKIIPALDAVGVGYESGKVYLPQLLMSAEAAKRAFDKIKDRAKGDSTKKRGPIVIATVKGDIHDIGKNIVKLLLENYGFEVIDLGRDVPAAEVVDAVRAHGAKLVGLSALMTTTLPAMKETVRLLHELTPDVKVVVGGAVLNLEYAEKIGADKYAPEAIDTVRYAESVL